MPFKNAEDDKKFRYQYQADLRDGKRRREPQTLEDALVELRELRVMVIQQRKRIHFLENKEKANARQRARRGGNLALKASAALKDMLKDS